MDLYSGSRYCLLGGCMADDKKRKRRAQHGALLPCRHSIAFCRQHGGSDNGNHAFRQLVHACAFSRDGSAGRDCPACGKSDTEIKAPRFVLYIPGSYAVNNYCTADCFLRRKQESAQHGAAAADTRAEQVHNMPLFLL